jgi:DNA-binding transcriptional MerR regulator
MDNWKVGELAKKTGLSVRALHHYDAIGLLTPSNSTDSGHRLYARSDLEKLQQIVALKHFGFSLDQIREALGQHSFSPIHTILTLKHKVESKMLELSELSSRLAAVEQTLTQKKDVSSKDLIELIERITMLEKYFTPEQLEKTNQIEKGFTPERLEQMVKKEWPALLGEVEKELNLGTSPSDPKVQVLAKRWMKLVNEKTGGDKGIASTYSTIFAKEPAFAAETAEALGSPGADLPKMIRYMREAIDSTPSNYKIP